GFLRVALPCAGFDHVLESFLLQVCLELVRRKLEEGRTAPVTGDDVSRRPDPCPSRRIASRNSDRGRLRAGRGHRYELDDFFGQEGNRISPESLADSEREPDDRADLGPKGRRLDPEVVREKRRRREKENDPPDGVRSPLATSRVRSPHCRETSRAASDP